MHGKLVRSVLAAVAVLMVAFSPAAAVTDGEYAGPDDYPYVALMVAFSGGEPLWRCSGTFVSPQLYVTAGHCTYGADHVEIWLSNDVRDDARYPFEGDVGGTPYTHESYDPNAFALYDLGVVVLDRGQKVKLNRYGELPALDAVDAYSQGDPFTAVGYGLQESFPDAAAWKNVAERHRMIAYPRLIQINQGIVGSESLLLSNNANTGGTCFGDSGGPNFIGDTRTIAGVTSFGMNGTCAGTGGVYRIDRADDLNWLYNNFSQYMKKK